MSWIRWWGVGAFAAIVGAVFGLWLLFADTVVRWAIEGVGTRMVGARVELEAAEVGFSPARLELRGLAVTNPKRPLRNALEAERIAFDLDWIGLLLDRVRIDTVAVEGLRFGTERARSGSVARTERQVGASRLLRTARERAEIPPLEVPSVETVLARESLRSPAVIEQAASTVEERRQALQQRLGELPGEAELERYRRELDAATAGGDTEARLKGLKRLKKLADAIEDDVKALRRARDEAKQSLAASRDAVGAARRAPGEDVDRLYRKYTDPRAVATELAHYLLGPRVEGWMNQGWYWYDRLSPFLGGGGDVGEPVAVPATRNPGRDIVYPEALQQPRVLVREVRLSGASGSGDLGGRVSDIASPAGLWPEPLRIELAGNALDGLKRLRAEATVDRRRPGEPVSRIALQAGGSDISGLGLGPEGALQADRGSADFTVDGNVRGRALDLDLAVVIDGVAFSAAADAQPILREVAAALGRAGRLRIGATVKGTIDAPELELRSSLADLVEPLLRERLQAAAAGFRDELAGVIRDRAGSSLDTLNRSLEQLDGLEAQVRGRLGEFEGVLKKTRKSLD